jgi:hypothetical protein
MEDCLMLSAADAYWPCLSHQSVGQMVISGPTNFQNVTNECMNEQWCGEQVKLMREKFRQALGEEGARIVDVNTVDGFQVCHCKLTSLSLHQSDL